MCRLLRRLFVLALLAGAAYAISTALMRRRDEPQGDAPSWPPFDDGSTAAPAAEPAPTAGFADVGAEDGRGTAETTDSPGDPAGDNAGDDDTKAAATTDDSPDTDDTGAAATTDDSPDTDDTGAAATTDTATTDDSSDADGAGETTDTDGAERRWAEPVDGQCPEGYPIKGNDDSGIYHVPGGRFYDRTIPERCYANEDDAIADGYRRSKA